MAILFKDFFLTPGWALGSISRSDPMQVGICVGCRNSEYLSNKTNFNKSMFMESEL